MLIVGLKYLYVSAPNQWLQLLDPSAGDLCEGCCLGHHRHTEHQPLALSKDRPLPASPLVVDELCPSLPASSVVF